MRIKHYTLLFAFLAIFMGIPLIQGCSDPFDEHGNSTGQGWLAICHHVR